MKITNHRVVTVVYRLTNSQGRIISQALSDDPVTYLHGSQSLIGKIDGHLSGLSPSSEITVSIAPSATYGAREEKALFSIPREKAAHINTLSPGLPLLLKMYGNYSQYWIVSVDDDHIHLDGNHPLSGKHLTAWVWILDVRKATKEEIASGRALVEERLGPDALRPA